MSDQEIVDTPPTPMIVIPPAPQNVIAALARVEAEVGGIEKKKKDRNDGDRGVPYAFRGIDAISQAAQPLLGKYGVVIVPTVENHVIDEIVVADKPWTDTTVTVLWKIYGPGGITDMIECRTIGYGRDNSDKGMNKAMTGAFKNVLLRVLCIGDPQDDTDGHTHERDGGSQVSQAAPEFSERSLAAFTAMSGLSDDAKDNLKALAAEYDHKLTARDMDADEGWLLVVEGVILNDKPVAPSPSTGTPETPEAATGPGSEPSETAGTVRTEGVADESTGAGSPASEGSAEPSVPVPVTAPDSPESAAEKRKRLAAEKKAQAGLNSEPEGPHG